MKSFYIAVSAQVRTKVNFGLNMYIWVNIYKYLWIRKNNVSSTWYKSLVLSTYIPTVLYKNKIIYKVET